MHDDFAEVDDVSFNFLEKMDRSDMEIAEHLIMDNKILNESSTCVDGELHIVADVNMVLDSHVAFYMVGDSLAAHMYMDLLMADMV